MSASDGHVGAILPLPVRPPPVTVGLAHLLPGQPAPGGKGAHFLQVIYGRKSSTSQTQSRRGDCEVTHQTPTCYRSPSLQLSSFVTPHPLFAPSIIYHPKCNPPPPHPSLSPLPPHPESFAPFLYLSHHAPSFSPSLVPSPGRLQMVLNGRRTECNCFVNNSTDTR